MLLARSLLGLTFLLPASAHEDLEARCGALEALEGLLTRARVPGISMAAADAEGRVVWRAVRGVRDRRDPRDRGAVGFDTVFEAASLSKPGASVGPTARPHSIMCDVVSDTHLSRAAVSLRSSEWAGLPASAAG